MGIWSFPTYVMSCDHVSDRICYRQIEFSHRVQSTEQKHQKPTAAAARQFAKRAGWTFTPLRYGGTKVHGWKALCPDHKVQEG